MLLAVRFPSPLAGRSPQAGWSGMVRDRFWGFILRSFKPPAVCLGFLWVGLLVWTGSPVAHGQSAVPAAEHFLTVVRLPGQNWANIERQLQQSGLSYQVIDGIEPAGLRGRSTVFLPNVNRLTVAQAGICPPGGLLYSRCGSLPQSWKPSSGPPPLPRLAFPIGIPLGLFGIASRRCGRSGCFCSSRNGWGCGSTANGWSK